MSKPSVKCHCGECSEEETFECEQCKRIVPWCMGADDDYFELCDECAIAQIEYDKQLARTLNEAVKKFGLGG